MEILLLLLTMVLLALAAKGAGALRVPIPVATTSNEFREDPDDGLVNLPSPDTKLAYTDKASRAEMTFAGQYLNLAGLALLTLGTISYLRVSGLAARATSGGLLPCLAGLGLGLFLTWSGERFHRQGMKNYALPLLAAGIVILTFSVGACHFTFHLLPMAGLMVANFAIVAWSGLAAIRYDSPMIGGCMLAAMFLDPIFMGFPLDQTGVALAYLLTINLAVTLVAYRKKWDGFLIASLSGSYLLYFFQFGLNWPWSALAFLVMTYAMFLISGNLFHFLRRTASDFNLGLSMVNPLLFACVSYLVLLKLPNAAALVVYTTVALIHAGLAALALKPRGQGEAYRQMAQANMTLAILFSTAAVSFLTYCSTTTSYFALVTGLWVAQSFVLLVLAARMGEHFSPLARRGSYGAMTLASIQSAYVVPTMEQPFWLQLACMMGQLAYFAMHQRLTASREQKLFANLVLLSAIASGYHCFPFSLFSVSGLLAGAGLAVLAKVAYLRYPETLVAYRFLAPSLAAMVTVVAVMAPWPLTTTSLSLIPLAALLAALTPLSLLRDELGQQSLVGLGLATLVLLRGCAVVAGSVPVAGLALASLTAFALYQASRRLPLLEQTAWGLGLMLGLAALLVPAQHPGELASLLAIMVLYAVAAVQAHFDLRPAACGAAAGLAGLIAMRLALIVQGGPGATLLWCLLGLALLRRGLGPMALSVMFLAFLKSIILDANFTLGPSGLELSAGPSAAGLALTAAVIACYGQAARATRAQPELRNYYSLFGLLIFAFHITFMLFTIYGVLDAFQVILSGFWAAASLLFVAYGIHRENKLFRLFGLVVLVSCVLKIYAVDIWVLDAYNQTTTTLVLGSLLMVVSFLYQTNRARLEQPCQA